MAVNQGIRLEGVRELSKALAELPVKVQKAALRKATKEASDLVVAAARSAIPIGVDAHKTYKGRLVAPGFASRNVKAVVRVSRDLTRSFARIGVSREAFYAVNFVELGTSRQAAQPWLRPALQSVEGQAIGIFAMRFKKAIEAAARRQAKARRGK